LDSPANPLTNEEPIEDTASDKSKKTDLDSVRDQSEGPNSDLEITGSQPITSRVRRSPSVEYIGEALTPVRHTTWRPNRVSNRASSVVSAPPPPPLGASLGPRLQLHSRPHLQTSWARPLGVLSSRLSVCPSIFRRLLIPIISLLIRPKSPQTTTSPLTMCLRSSAPLEIGLFLLRAGRRRSLDPKSCRSRFLCIWRWCGRYSHESLGSYLWLSSNELQCR